MPVHIFLRPTAKAFGSGFGLLDVMSADTRHEPALRRTSAVRTRRTLLEPCKTYSIVFGQRSRKPSVEAIRLARTLGSLCSVLIVASCTRQEKK